MKKGKKGKGDDEMLADAKRILELDIEVLEKDIHLEEIREMNAIKEYEELIKKSYEMQEKVDYSSGTEVDSIKYKMLCLEKVESDKNEKIIEEEDNIKILKKEKANKEEEAKEREKEFQRQIRERDEAILAQQRMFKNMAEKFAKILRTTTSKSEEEARLEEEMNRINNEFNKK